MNTNRQTFNTGRGYSPEGQIIHAEFAPLDKQQHGVESVLEGWLSFYDETRGLWGKYSVALDVERDNVQQVLMSLYDSNAERHSITFAEAEALKPSDAMVRAEERAVDARAKATYRWKITKDHIDGGRGVGVQGPRNLDESVTSNPARFSLYDDDNICYYEGMLYGDDYQGFEPLDDYGTPNAGCVKMKLDGEWL